MKILPREVRKEFEKIQNIFEHHRKPKQTETYDFVSTRSEQVWHRRTHWSE